MRKNVAGQYLSVALINVTTGAALTGATPAVRRNLDGVDAAVTGSVTEPNSDGKYLFALSQADTNGDDCSYFFTAANAIPVCLNVHTSFPQTGDSYGVVTNATYGNSAIETLVDDLESTIGVAGAGLTAITGATLNTTQPAITWAQQKIVANVANEGALDIRNANADGHGTLNDGGEVGLYSSGGTYGQYNAGTASHGVVNTGGAYGQYNGGGDSGVYNSGVNYGVKSDGGTAGQYNLGNGGMGYGQQNVGDAIGQYNVGSGAGSAGQTNQGVAQGQHNNGATGQQNDGGAVGQYNAGTTYGAQNTGASGQVNVGTAGDGLYASGTDYGIQAVGVTGDTDPDWSGGGGLTAQQTRDAMTLAPTPGAPAAGSVDAHLDTLITGVNVTSMANDVLTAGALATSAVNEIVDQVWDEVIAGHLAVGSTGAALNGAGGGATVFPTGAIDYTYTLKDSVTLNPVPNADIWISTDLAGTNVIWRGTSDAFGVARNVMNDLPALDPGTYYFWSQVGTNPGDAYPDTEVVS